MGALYLEGWELHFRTEARSVQRVTGTGVLYLTGSFSSQNWSQKPSESLRMLCFCEECIWELPRRLNQSHEHPSFNWGKNRYNSVIETPVFSLRSWRLSSVLLLRTLWIKGLLPIPLLQRGLKALEIEIKKEGKGEWQERGWGRKYENE